MKITAIIFLILISISSSAWAGYYSGTDIISYLDKFNRGEEDFETGLSIGYVMGITDSVSGLRICRPKGVQIKQIIQIVYNYMNRHPEDWNKSAHISVEAALSEVWPCKKK